MNIINVEITPKEHAKLRAKCIDQLRRGVTEEFCDAKAISEAFEALQHLECVMPCKSEDAE